MVRSQAALGQLFISYRRDDSKGFAGRICDRLISFYGRRAVFRDVGMTAGSRFREVIPERLAGSKVVLALIGPRWLSPGSDGRARLFEPDDFVTFELARALETGAKVIPVLVDGAQLPTAAQLPPQLQHLPQLQAAHVRDQTFAADMRDLAAAIGVRWQWGLRWAALGLLVLGTVGALIVATMPPRRPAAASPHITAVETHPAAGGRMVVVNFAAGAMRGEHQLVLQLAKDRSFQDASEVDIGDPRGRAVITPLPHHLLAGEFWLRLIVQETESRRFLGVASEPWKTN